MVIMQAETTGTTINEAVQAPQVVAATEQTTQTVTEQPAPNAPEESQPPSVIEEIVGNPLFMFIIIIAIMYFLMIRPQRKRQKEIDNFRRSLRPGMEVVTSGGLYGKIKEIDNGIVVIEIAHNVNVRVDVSVVFANPGAMQDGAK